MYIFGRFKFNIEREEKEISPGEYRLSHDDEYIYLASGLGLYPLLPNPCQTVIVNGGLILYMDKNGSQFYKK